MTTSPTSTPHQPSPDWLRDAVLKGIKGLMTLRLEGAPGEDTVGPMAQAWLAILRTLPHTWREDRDRPRITGAFLQLAANSERWPAPAAFLRLLSPVVLDTQHMLTAPRSTTVHPAFRALVQKLKASAAATPAPPSNPDEGMHEPPAQP